MGTGNWRWTIPLTRSSYIIMPVGGDKWLFVSMSESLNHWFKWFIQNTDAFRKKSVFISKSLNHSINQFVQNSDSFWNKTP